MSTNKSYWDRITRERLSRRRLLKAGASLSLGATALALVGCGDDDDSGSGDNGGGDNGGGGGGGVPTVSDPTKGVPGGTLIFGQASALPAGRLDPVTGPSTNYTYLGLSYTSLLGHNWGQDSVGLFDYYNLEPDVAAALPEQPDELTYNFKIRPNVKFHDGTSVTAKDVAFSINRYASEEKGTFYSSYQAWFDKVEAPDDSTIVLKTKLPYADAIISMGGNYGPMIMSEPHVESGKINDEMMGTGPFRWSKGPPDPLWEKNPDYHLSPYPYFDKVQAIEYKDPSKRVSDFIAGTIHVPWLVYAEDRDLIKKERPDAKFQGWTSWGQTIFLRDDQEPFNDDRVRKALSMSIDRQKVRDGTLKGEGRDDQWFPLMYKDLFQFREVSELGDAAQYWKYDPTTAKQLLSAAGVTLPIKSTMVHWPAFVIGQFHIDIGTLTQAGWRELGIAEVEDVDQPTAQYVTTSSRGEFDGMNLSVTSGFNSGAPAFTQSVKNRWYTSPSGDTSPLNFGRVNNPELNALAEKQVTQLKLEDRIATYHQMEQIIADNVYHLQMSTTTQNYFFDPKLRNALMAVEQGARRYMMKWWFAE